MLIVDNFAHSPIVTAIFCFAFTTVAHPLRQAFPTCLTLSSVVRTELPALCLARDLYYNPLFTPPRLSFLPLASPSSLERRNAPSLGLVSLSSRSSAQASRIYVFATWCMKEVVSAARCRRLSALQVVADRRSARRGVTHPSHPRFVATVKIPSSLPTSVGLVIPTERRSDGRGSISSSHHERDTLANERY